MTGSGAVACGLYTAEYGMRLFDTASRHGNPILVARTDGPGLGRGMSPRSSARCIVPSPGGPPLPATRQRGGWRPSGTAEREDALLKLVRDSAATVLGHADTSTIPATTAFKDLGHAIR
ncbi:acyl carrier protein [Streptomyces rapamycinicus]|uniref:Uncharacterized protein n=1 Tax=Streptomyces rapamycinicus TaxID=1226757 RepID=A0ABR6M4V2_9ACTN|nr:acyl carrier protein [Streptomyces rapamycinicus]MBB4789346.1 hypothetical protein [Streptomyces rapamycinicus]